MRMSEDYQAIAQRIKQRRLELNLSLQDVADITDMSKSTLQRYEAGSIRNIPLQKLGVLAQALQTSADWLLGWVKEPSDITLLDMNFREFMKAIGFYIYAKPGKTSKIYFSGDCIGQASITSDEYKQLRDSIISYAKFNAINLLNQAVSREDQRIAGELAKFEAYRIANEGNTGEM